MTTAPYVKVCSSKGEDFIMLFITCVQSHFKVCNKICLIYAAILTTTEMTFLQMDVVFKRHKLHKWVCMIYKMNCRNQTMRTVK